MYIITNNDEIILGPVDWNYRFFNSVIEDECDISMNLNQFSKDNLPIEFETIKIRPVHNIYGQITNPKIQTLSGPIWEFFDDYVNAYWNVVDKPISIVKTELSEFVTNERYKKETAGFMLNIQGIEVFVDTSRGNRDIFFQKLLMMGDNDTVNWKFPQTWLTLSKLELGYIVQSGAAHIQQ